MKVHKQETTLNLALIGLGVSAKTNHLPALANSKRFRLLAIVDPIQTCDDARCFETVAELRQSDLDIHAVALCTPPSDRLALIEQCIEEGWHVLLEKPPVAAADDLETLYKIVEATDRSIFASWHSAESPAVDAAANWLEQHPVRECNLRWLEHVNDWHPNQNWLWQEGGFGVFDAGINAFSILLNIIPDSLSIVDAELSVPENAGAPAAAQLQFAIGDQPVGKATLDLLHAGKPVWEISILSGGSQLLITEGGKALSIDGQTVHVEGLAEYDRIYNRFAEMIDQGQSNLDAHPLELVLSALNKGKQIITPPIDFGRV